MKKKKKQTIAKHLSVGMKRKGVGEKLTAVAEMNDEKKVQIRVQSAMCEEVFTRIDAGQNEAQLRRTKHVGPCYDNVRYGGSHIKALTKKHCKITV